MHETTRRRSLIAGALLLSVAPVVGTALWSLRSCSTKNLSIYKQELRKHVGLDVFIDSMVTPHPFTNRLQGVQLSEPATGKVVAEFGDLEIRRTENGIIVKTEQPSSIHGPIERILELVHQRVFRSEALAGRIADFWCSQMVMHNGDDERTLHGVMIRVRNTDMGPRAVVSFRADGVDMPAQIDVVHRRGQRPTTDVSIRTAGIDLGCWMFSSSLASQLGVKAQFNGAANVQLSERSRSMKLRGTLSHVDLSQLVGKQIQERCHGWANIEVELADIRNGSIHYLKAGVSSGPGEVSRTLVQTLADQMGLVYLGPRGGDSIKYEKLDCQVLIDHRGLWLAGNGPISNVIMHTSGTPILGGSSIGPVTPDKVARILAPNSRRWMPASHIAAELFRRLPAATESKPAASTARRPQGLLY